MISRRNNINTATKKFITAGYSNLARCSSSSSSSTSSSTSFVRACSLVGDGSELRRRHAAATRADDDCQAVSLKKRKKSEEKYWNNDRYRQLRGFAAKTSNEEEASERRDISAALEFVRKSERTGGCRRGRTNPSIVNVPNMLSVSRAMSGPFIANMIVKGTEVYSGEFVISMIAIAGISDYLDGYLARKWKQESNFGSFFDAAADKVFVSSVGVGMACAGQLPAWMVALFVVRDVGFLGSGLWRRANALEFEKLTWRQYFAIDEVNEEDEKFVDRSRGGLLLDDDDDKHVQNKDENNISINATTINDDDEQLKKSAYITKEWEAFNSTEKWEPLYIGKVATAMQMGLLAVAASQSIEHVPILFETIESQKLAIEQLVKNVSYATFGTTTYATAAYARAYFSHPGFKNRREALRLQRKKYSELIGKKYTTLKQNSKEKIEQKIEQRKRRLALERANIKNNNTENENNSRNRHPSME